MKASMKKKKNKTCLFQYYLAAIIGFFLLALMTTCSKTKTTGPAPFTGNIVHFSKDTLFWNVLFIDTVHATALSASLSPQKGYSIHLIDSERGMSVKDSIFFWTPQDTGRMYVNGTVCGTSGNCDTLRDTLYVVYASNMARPYKFSRDTIARFVRFADTLRPDSSSIARFGQTAYVYHCIDSIANMTVQDSVISWLPLDTGRFQMRIARCIAGGHCDTLRGSLCVINAPLPALSFRFSSDTLCYSVAYFDTLHASKFAAIKSMGRINSFYLIDQGNRSMTLTDSIFLYIPWDTGWSSVSMVVGDAAGNYFSIKDTFFVHQCAVENLICPSYTHKNDVTFGRQSDLPVGFFVYAYEYDPANLVSGLYISDIRNFSSSLVPTTEYELPRSINISDDGKWILYANGLNNAYVISIDGSRKYQVPLSGTQVNMVDFYRNGPNGVEICYTTTDTVRQEIYAIQVKLDSVPTFGTIRTIADITGSFRIERYYPISIAKDQILGAFSLLWQGAYVLRMGFLTIPDAGRGIALSRDMYKWADETDRQVWGCNSTMSSDGSKCLYIPGAAGMGGSGAMSICIPPEHRGFVVTPFRHVTDSAITVDDHIDKYGLSINWCPPQYNFGTWDQMDIHAWNFGNNNDLVIGTQTGTMTPVKCVWMVDWKNNVWTQLTPPDSTIAAGWAAVYFTGTDTGNVLDPHYHVVRPNGGEQFFVGQACTVMVTSQRNATAGVRLKIDNGKYVFLLPGMTTSINPRIDSTFIFAIPDSFTIDQGGGETVRVSSVSDSCAVCVTDYAIGTGFKDCSDNIFSIKAAP